MNISVLHKNSARCIAFGLFLSLVMPFQPSYAVSVDLNVNIGEQQKEEQIKPEILPVPVLVSRAFANDSYRSLDLNSEVLDAHSARELQLSWLVEKLDRTQTYIGSSCLGNTLNPTNEISEIERRQSLIKTLMDNPHLFNNMTLALQSVAKSEEAVLTYWNEKDPVTYNIAGCYFSSFASLNKSKLALEGATLFDFGSRIKNLVGLLFLQGLFTQLERWDNQGDFDQSKVFDGFSKFLLLDHNPFTANVMDEQLVQRLQITDENDPAYINPANNNNIYRQIIENGTLLDKIRYREAASNRQQDTWKNKTGFSFFGTPVTKGWNKFSAWGEKLLFTAMYDYYLWTIFISTKKGLIQSHRNLEALRTRMVQVADFIKAVQVVEKLVNQNPELQKVLPAKIKNDLALSKSLSAKMRELVELLNTATFKKSISIFYLRGKVLYANLLFSQIKHELVPAMKAVGEIDAYCSIARLVQESDQNQNKFSFVTFDETAQAYLELDGCWISVLNPNEAVANSMTLGKTKPGKVIITGPNGGGKSTWLKAAGQAVVLAQAWGIAPARHAHMSIFDAVRTSLEPRENLAGGISKFMAQKESMDKIQRFVLEEKNKVALILLDEPYDGTVTDEIARRAGEFCDNVVTSNNCLAIIATHVMPTLANEKMYGWYHVDIAEPKRGEFRRTFRLRSGLAKRWFHDQAWRGRFIDWLSIEMRKKAIEEARAKALQAH